MMNRRLDHEARFFVIEDGGYVTPLLHTDEFATLRGKCMGVVEQTTKGLRAIRTLVERPGLNLPVVAVAASRLKLQLEAAEVGDALAFTLEHYFRMEQQVSVAGLSTLLLASVQ
jgi:S-adenosylhomocysteine hydrolase